MPIKSDVKKVHKNKKGKFLTSFIIILLLVGAGVLLFNVDFDELKNKFNQEDLGVSSAIYNEKEESFEDLGTSGDNSSNSSEHQAILSFAPEEEQADGEEEVTDEKIESMNPYSKHVKHDDSINEKRLLKLQNAFNEYRLYLANTNKLLTKFAADESYSDELYILKRLPCSAKAQEVILLLEFYNKQLVDQNSVDNKVIDIKVLDSNLLKKLVKVKRVKMGSAEQRALKEKIQNKLHILTDYIFSAELQQSFLDK